MGQGGFCGFGEFDVVGVRRENASRTVGGRFRYRISLRTVEACFLYRMPQKMRRVPQEGVSGTESSHRGKGPVGKTGQEKQGSWGNPVCRITQKDYTKGTPNRAHGTIKRKRSTVKVDLLWELRESNPRPSACKADALNQLS